MAIEPPDLPTPVSAPLGDGWQALPARGGSVAALGGAMGAAFPFVGIGFVLSHVTGWVSAWVAVPAMLVLGALVGAWIAWRRHARLRWRLDDTGFAVRRGNWWQSETHVPISRVQHLDLKRGPIERSLGLSTLVVHTAGSRQATVSVAALDAQDGERLRDRLAHQLDHDDALG